MTHKQDLVSWAPHGSVDQINFYLPSDAPVAVGRDRELSRKLHMYGKAQGFPFSFSSGCYLSPSGAAKMQTFILEFGKPLGAGTCDGLLVYDSVRRHLNTDFRQEVEHPSCDYVCFEKGFFLEANQFGLAKPIPYSDIESFRTLKRGVFLPLWFKSLDGSLQINFRNSELKDVVIKSNRLAIVQLSQILTACGVMKV